MNNKRTSLSHLDDEELLQHVYLSVGLRTELELELAVRLQHLMDETDDHTKHKTEGALDAILTRYDKGGSNG